MQGLSFLCLCVWSLLCGRSLWSILRPSRYKLIVGGLYLAYSLLTTILVSKTESPSAMLALLLIVNLWPVAALVLGAYIFKEQIKLWFGLGLVLTLAGGILVVSGGEVSVAAIWAGLARQPMLTLLAVVAVATWALCSNLMRKWPEEGDDYMIFGMGMAAVGFATVSVRDVCWQVMNLNFPPILLILAGLNAAGFGCWELGMRNGNTANLMIAAYFIPVTAALATAWYFKLPLTLPLAMAALCVSVGALISRSAVRPAGSAMSGRVDGKAEG